MSGLTIATRRMENLFRAWTVVRGNVLAAGRQELKAEVHRISENPIPYLRRIQEQLAQNKFIFSPQRGVLKTTKSTRKKRPIVVAPIENRIVQRAILNVLQSERDRDLKALGRIPSLLMTPTSVGGIPKRGVGYGIGLVRNAIRLGATHFLRSDIREFFTKVPKSAVVTFVREQTLDAQFAALFERALTTELENEDEIREDVSLFPLHDIGVPQGSSLSAFAGNVVLAEFDQVLNTDGVVSVRYIDDFVILGPSERAVRNRFNAGKKILSDLGMTAYDPVAHPTKAALGSIARGFDFLGCSVRPDGTMPSRGAKSKLLEEIQDLFSTSLTRMHAYCNSDDIRRAEDAYFQTLALADRKIRGWGDAFSFCDSRLPFSQIDERVDRLYDKFRRAASNALKKAETAQQRRRALGIALLVDTPRGELHSAAAL